MIIELMGAGFTKVAAAGKIGVSKQTLLNWAKENDEFFDALKVAEAARLAKLETDLLEAPDGPTVTARIFALKNAEPEEWRNETRLELTGKAGGPIEVEETVRTDADDFVSAMVRLAAAGVAEGETSDPEPGAESQS